MEVSERDASTNDGSSHALAGLDGTLHSFHKLPKRNPALLDGIALQQTALRQCQNLSPTSKLQMHSTHRIRLFCLVTHHVAVELHEE